MSKQNNLKALTSKLMSKYVKTEPQDTRNYINEDANECVSIVVHDTYVNVTGRVCICLDEVPLTRML